MQNQPIRKVQRSNTSSNLPSYIVKIHISPRQLTQITIYPDSDIDLLIHQCIIKHRLKKQAHSYLKQQISLHIQKVKSNQRCKTQYSISKKLFIESSDCIKNPLIKKQTILRDLKFGDIDKKKISIQRTPKNVDNITFKKQGSYKNHKHNQSNPKIYIRKKTQSEKQNIQNISLFCKKYPDESLFPDNFLKNIDNKLQYVDSSFEKMKKKRKFSHDKSCNEKYQDQGEFIRSFKKDCSMSLKAETQQDEISSKLKTQNSVQPCQKMKQFSLIDLQKQMQEQMIDLKYQKRIKRLQPQLCSLFNSIIRRNPPKINRIDPRFAYFDDLSQVVIKPFHQFLINLSDQELNCLDFENFKRLLVKYRGSALLDCLK